MTSTTCGAAIEHGLRGRCPSLTDPDISAIKFSSSTYASKEFEYLRVGGLAACPHPCRRKAADALIVDLGVLLVGRRRLRLWAQDPPWLDRATGRQAACP